ncbi:Hypothetical protein HDN1F_25700 [gamma proteobacterium HdN1]|nr:Hypothetical protein HDN1F_25700 [gamma proteobacterium HdN1]
MSQPTLAASLIAGLCADRIGYAFAGGYIAALQRLLPEAVHPDRANPLSAPAAFCVTEAAGNRPRQIQTKIEITANAFTLTGSKSFVTLADHAQWLWVVASRGEINGRNALVLAGVERNSPGITFTPLPALPFAPEISHAQVQFDHVNGAMRDLLPGDAYTEYVKPFRTLEDTHVAAATCGLLLGQAIRRHWPEDAIEPWFSLATHWLSIASLPPTQRATHLALGGAMSLQKTMLEQHRALILQDGEFAARFTRDAPLLNVARSAREKRSQNAWSALQPQSQG